MDIAAGACTIAAEDFLLCKCKEMEKKQLQKLRRTRTRESLPLLLLSLSVCREIAANKACKIEGEKKAGGIPCLYRTIAAISMSSQRSLNFI